MKAVVPYAGTWIETILTPLISVSGTVSFPTRERGLKLYRIDNQRMPCRSFPTRERGLKLTYPPHRIILNGVVPYAGTWIETPGLINIQLPCLVVPYAGTWIETLHSILRNLSHGRSLRGNVD